MYGETGWRGWDLARNACHITRQGKGTDMELNRRSFVQGAACLGVGAAALGSMALAPRAGAAEGSAITFADTVEWNGAYDVVVVGFGGSGAVASIYAADAGAKVLMCDVAPEGEEGGNTRFAAQMCMSGEDPDKLYTYYRDGLFWHFNADEESLRTYTDAACQMTDLMKYLGAKEEDMSSYPAGKTIVTPEYPEYEGNETVTEWFVSKGMYDGSLWQLLRKNVVDRADNIDVWYESPALHLIQDPATKTVVGVEIDKRGETVRIRADRGVVLCCGGFENNTEMIQDYLGAARLIPFGTLHNNGDGVRMGIEVGADLWHMEAYESLGILAGNAWAVEDGQRLLLEKSLAGGRSPLISLNSEDYGKGSVILVGDDGSRFIDENGNHRHGHVYSCGVWRMPVANWAPHLIFDAAQFETLKNDGYITPEREATLVTAQTPEELAELIGADPEILARTIADFNFFAENGRDYQFNRDPESMRPLAGDTYYAAEFRPGVLNTQGGPRRTKDAEVVDTAGAPIPHLYSAGELGGITAFQYNSGGNLAECMIFGKIAGTNAAAEKEPLAPIEAPAAVESTITYEPGKANDLSASAEADVKLGDGEYLGTGAGGMGGDIQVKVTMDGDKISAIEVVKESETPEIGGKAFDTLIEEVVAANSTEVEAVSGATITSKAFLAAVQDAVAQA